MTRRLAFAVALAFSAPAAGFTQQVTLSPPRWTPAGTCPGGQIPTFLNSQGGVAG